LIFHNPANTEKLNPTNIAVIVNIAPQESISPDNINFCPNNIKAISGHVAIINPAKKNENTKK